MEGYKWMFDEQARHALCCLPFVAAPWSPLGRVSAWLGLGAEGGTKAIDELRQSVISRALAATAFM